MPGFDWLDKVSRHLAGRASRRQVLRGVGAGVGSGLLGSTLLRGTAAEANAGGCTKNQVKCNGRCCALGQICCDGVCTDIAGNPNNCGGCAACGGHVCGGNQICQYGLCKNCSPGKTPCAGKCVNMSNDPANCGTCGHTCPPGQACQAGTCGGGGGCSSASDCPGSDTDCQTRTCVAGVCGFSFAPSGTPTSQQISGDCRKNVCDGQGGSKSIVDNADAPPDDGNICTNEVCSGGVPSHPPAPAGTACPGGLCDGTGVCVGCSIPSDCPGNDSVCQTRTCVAGTCGFTYAPEGTFVSQSGCTKTVCDGAGGQEFINVCFCGNGIADPGEACDGADLRGETCVTQGFGVGTLACSADCHSFDTSACAP